MRIFNLIIILFMLRFIIGGYEIRRVVFNEFVMEFELELDGSGKVRDDLRFYEVYFFL